MSFVEMNIERYGKKGRAAAIADYWELCALDGRRISEAQIADKIDDNGWSATEVDLVRSGGTSVAGSLGEEQEGSRRIAARARLLVERRSVALRDEYPFAWVGPRLALKSGFDVRSSSYVALLAMSVLHAWDIPTPHNVEMEFERLVVRAVAAKGIPAAEMGTSSHGGGAFVDRLEDATRRLGLRADADAAARAVFAQDEGVDVLAALLWPDDRAGQWIWIGQATCASSDVWRAKINDASPKQWEKFLLESVRPIPFLAVPHHVDDSVFEWVIQKGHDATVLDRVRLVLSSVGLSEADRALIDTLLQTDLEAEAA